MRILTSAAALIALALPGCGVVYQSPQVSEGTRGDSRVQVVTLTPETVLAANRSTYRPKSLPAIFGAPVSTGALRGAGALPEVAGSPQTRPATLAVQPPPAAPDTPYTIGVGDVVLLATPSTGTTVAELSGLLAAQTKRQGYTVQDDGAIAVPEVGRISIAGLTLEDAEAEVFRRLVDAQIEPAFSLEIAEFRSKKVSIGGAVKAPSVVPISLTPLRLDAALVATGGVTAADQDFVTIRIYRDGKLYQIPLTAFYEKPALQKTRLIDGDSVFVDTAYELERAQSYFQEQIALAGLRTNARTAAAQELNAEITLRNAELTNARANLDTQIALDSLDRDFVYLTGEVGQQGRYGLPFGRTASLADALYGTGEGVPNNTGNARNIYVLRSSPDPREFGAVTAWQLDARNASNLVLATKFEMRPNDVIFIAEQPVTRWSRVVSQITPSIINLTTQVANP